MGGPLVVTSLVARVLPIADQERAAVDIEIDPFDAADLVEPHGRSLCELHDPRHRRRQALIVIVAAEQAVQLVCTKTPIPLRALANQTQPLERDTRQIDGFWRDVEAVHGRRMGDDHLDHADVDPERYQTVRRSNRSTGPICRTRLT